jgi:pimeloyl-ACP methyl ester carboxylesterase
LRRSAALATALAACVLAAACAVDADDAAAPTTPVAEITTTTNDEQAELTFYRPSTTLGEGEPGDVLSMEPTTIDPTWPGTATRIMFVSTTPLGDPVPVTGVVIVPTTPPPPGGYPVVVWAHGTVGLGDPCAPSRHEPFQAAGGKELLTAGHAIVAPDYEGLGIEDETHPYLVGEATGNNILDAARAARSFGGGTRVAVFGASQGGHATLFARELATAYAPELDLVGVVAAAPVTDPARFALQGETDPELFPFLAEVILAWSEVYDEPDLTDLVVVRDAEAVRLARDEWCTESLAPTRPLDEIILAEPQNTDVWQAGVRQNTPGADDLGVPVYLTHGDADPVVPLSGTEELHEELCDAGEGVIFERDPSWLHASAWTAPLPNIVTWIGARFDGAPPPTDCP